MKRKDCLKDDWLFTMRLLYERVFSYRNERIRYRDLEKVQFQVGIRVLVFNLKRVLIRKYKWLSV